MEEKIDSGKKNFLKIFYEEVSKSSFTIIILAIFTGLILGGVIACATTKEIYDAFGESFTTGIIESLKFIWQTYSSLFRGAFGNPKEMFDSLFSGDSALMRKAFKPFLESLVVTTPYLITGVAIALGIQAGVLNKGGEGQLFMGSILAGWAG